MNFSAGGCQALWDFFYLFVLQSLHILNNFLESQEPNLLPISLKCLEISHNYEQIE